MDKQKRHASQPWSTADATTLLNQMSRSEELDIWLTDHAEEQMDIRGLFMGDVLHVLKNGFVYADAEPATREGYYRYAIESRTPNSGNRDVKVIVIPNCITCDCKIVTVMWKDER